MGDMNLVDFGKRLLEAAKLGETDEVRSLMTNGAPFTTDWLGNSALHMAALNGHTTTAEVLLRGGISRDGKTKVDKTPLHVAATEGHLDIVKLLVAHSAEIDARDMLQMTPLHWAVERGHYHTTKFLLKNNANVHAVNKFDKNPLEIAEDNQDIPLIELLSAHAVQALTQEVEEKHQSQKKIKANPSPPETQTESSLSSISQIMKTPLPAILSPERKTAKMNTIKTIHIASPQNSSLNVNAKKSPAAKQVFVTASLPSKTTAASTVTSSSDSEESENSAHSSANVLATLAALAEATAPNATISTAEALQWLEMNGITMLPTDNSTVIGSALEGGQTVSLTEAGKLALSWMKEHQSLTNQTLSFPHPVTPKREDGEVSSSQNSIAQQKVITIVADQGRIPSIISTNQTPFVVLSSPTVKNDISSPPAKKLKVPAKSNDSTFFINGACTPTSSTSEEDERTKLKQELEKMKREAELYKTQLLLKEHEAEEYKKQLERIRTAQEE